MSEVFSTFDLIALWVGRIALLLMAVCCVFVAITVRCGDGVYGATIFRFGIFFCHLATERATRLVAHGYLCFKIGGDWYLGLSVPVFIYRLVRGGQNG